MPVTSSEIADLSKALPYWQTGQGGKECFVFFLFVLHCKSGERFNVQAFSLILLSVLMNSLVIYEMRTFPGV